MEIAKEMNAGLKKIIAACGNDCAACPRYTAHPCEKTQEELRRTVELWMKVGYRNRVVSDEDNEEIGCIGCSRRPENWCRYRVAGCAREKGVENCGQCGEYPCARIKKCFEVTKSFEPRCRAACTHAEYDAMRRAFFQKEENLRRESE